MKLYSIDEIPVIDNPVATIGIFDGVHRGHRYMLESLVSMARNTGGNAVVITLWPHPRIVLDKDVTNFRLLHSLEEKINHIGKLGIDYCVTIPFSKELSSMSACDFIREYMAGRLKAKKLLLGYDNSFGRDRQGNPETLAACAERSGMELMKLEEFKDIEINISSTSVRNALLEGDLETAREMLGYDYYLQGKVVAGNSLGRELGYPTANIHSQSDYKLIPKDGVYAAHVEHGDEIYHSMMYIGLRPTINSPSPQRVIEAHLFDTDLNMYGKEVVIHFRKRMRGEMKFPGLDELKEQLQKDEIAVRRYFSAK